MYQIDNPTAAAVRPASTALGSEGWFTDGSVTGGQSPTILPAEWLNMVQAELCNIAQAGGQVLNKSLSNQVLLALIAMFAPTAGSMRNAHMYVAAASTTATFTADQIVVAAALNGQPYALTSFNQTLNLATVGAGGMDVGTAPKPGYVAIYAIFNPAIAAANPGVANAGYSILATNATASAAPTIYAGGNMPAGYTSSALISVWTTNSSGQLLPGNQYDRCIKFQGRVAINTTTQAASLTPVGISGTIPPNAKSIGGNIALLNTNGGTGNTASLSSDLVGTGLKTYDAYIASANGLTSWSFEDLQIITSQTVYYTTNTNSGAETLNVSVNSYTF
jgi:hypothetical protein